MTDRKKIETMFLILGSKMFRTRTSITADGRKYCFNNAGEVIKVDDGFDQCTLRKDYGKTLDA